VWANDTPKIVTNATSQNNQFPTILPKDPMFVWGGTFTKKKKSRGSGTGKKRGGDKDSPGQPGMNGGKNAVPQGGDDRALENFPSGRRELKIAEG